MRSPERVATDHRAAQVFFLLGALLAFSTAGRALAQEASPASTEAEDPTAQPKISIHGFLTQAYAQSDGHQIVGIPEDGTADYRAAALQVRADITDKNSFVVQLSHERIGASPVMSQKEDVELDWIFYQHFFGDGDSTVRVGKVPIPFGIYNEVRDVGTILPFFRPSLGFYGEGTFNIETVDGVVLSHSFEPWGRWSLEGDVFFGGFEFLAADSDYFRVHAEGLYGANFWLQTPLPGLRIGAGTMHFDFHDTRQSSELNIPWSIYYVALAASGGPLVANAEFAYWDEDFWAFRTSYLHLGYRLTDRVTLNAQIEDSKFEIEGSLKVDYNDEKTLGVNYSLRPDLVLKAEHHWNSGYYTENPFPDLFQPPLETRFWILSLSTSF